MGMVALVAERGARAGFDHVPFDRPVVAVVDLHAVMGDDRPVALIEIGDLLGERGERERVRAEIGFALADADGERRAQPGTDDQPRMIAEQDGDGKGAMETRQHRCDRFLGSFALGRAGRRQMGDDLGIGLAFERRPLACISSRSALKFSMMPLWTTATPSTMCGWALPTVGAPWVAQRVWAMPTVPAAARRERAGEIVELALGATAFERAVADGADSGAVIAAIFEPPEAVHQPPGNLLAPDNADNPTHMFRFPP
jgi:hypothetical protein